MRHFTLIITILTALAAGFAIDATPALGATFTVNSTADLNDGDTGDNICDTGNLAEGFTGICTLRAAISQANGLTGTDTITFSIPTTDSGYNAGTCLLDPPPATDTWIIRPGTAMPIISGPVTIDGYTQPGASPNTNPAGMGSNAVIKIELNGLNAPGGVDGLLITSGGSTVKGLAIGVFKGDGIELRTNGGNTIEGNFIGTDITGTVVDPPLDDDANACGNNLNGVLINGITGNTIGGTAPEARNVISGNGVRTSPSTGDGIEISGAGATGNSVIGNFIGTDLSGTLDRGNLLNGVLVNGVSGNTIGGTVSGARNLISGNSSDGVELTGAGATGNSVLGNYIGPDVTGTLDRGNTSNGVLINIGAGNVVGGTASGARNLISGNGAGVVISGAGATANLVAGNYVGTDLTGTIDLGNTTEGVRITSVSGNTVGGTSAAARNVISGNGGDGVEISGSAGTSNLVQGNYIGLDASGSLALGNGSNTTGFGVRIATSASNNTIGGLVAGARNVISSNARGVEITGNATNQNLVQGNYIGLDAGGSVSLGNKNEGVFINGGHDNTIGGTTPEARNIISGNGSVFDTDGVHIFGSTATANLIQGNYIGTNASGTLVRGNSAAGVFIEEAPGNTIGGTAAGARNVISGNGRGVEIIGPAASGNLVQGNYIGTDAAGTAAAGNAADGIFISAVPGTTIGGTSAEARNVISGNANFGIHIFDINASGTLVQGNYIGTNAAGDAALPNGLDGVFINGAADNTIGGTSTSMRNLISGNDSNGVQISGVAATGNLVQGNFLGTNASGTGGVPNVFDGVRITGAASGNTVGGLGAGVSNISAFNSGNGVLIDAFAGTGNAVLSNSVFSNSSLGIDIDVNGVTANDLDDPDSGANNLQNYPQLTFANSSPFSTAVAGTLNSTPNTIFTLQFFASAACDPSGNGEGATFLGSFNVTTNGGGDVSFNQGAGVGGAGGQFITATATDPGGSTSEFSNCIQAATVSGTPTPTPPPTGTPTPTPTSTNGSTYGGDVDCDGDVDAVDALRVLRAVAGMPNTLPPGCVFDGDVDCDSDTDAVDALRILRYVAGLGNTLPPGCPPIGP